MRGLPAALLVSLSMPLAAACEEKTPSPKPAPEESSPERFAPDEVLGGGFEPIGRLESLHPEVQAELRRLTKERMANPGESYQATDVRLAELPMRRLVLGGVSKLSRRFWLVCYEHGGIGHHHHIALFEVHGDGVTAHRGGSWLAKRDAPITLSRVTEALKTADLQLGDDW
ncbi:MAG TPA: hypothetical protein VGK73_39770 [Polyangiaceae bacterium]